MRKLLIVHPPKECDASDLEFARCQIDELERAGTDIETLILSPGWWVSVVEGDEVIVRLQEIDR